MKNATLTNDLARSLLRQCEDVSQLFKSLSHPVRLKILCMLVEGEKSVNSLTEACDIPQSAMSQFLKRMKAEKILESRKEGTFNYYHITDDRLLLLLKSVKNIYCKS